MLTRHGGYSHIIPVNWKAEKKVHEFKTSLGNIVRLSPNNSIRGVQPSREVIGSVSLLLSLCFINSVGPNKVQAKSNYFFSVLSPVLLLVSWMNSQAGPAKLTNSLIYHIIKMSSSISNSDSSCNLNPFCPHTLGPVQAKEPVLG